MLVLVLVVARWSLGHPNPVPEDPILPAAAPHAGPHSISKPRTASSLSLLRGQPPSQELRVTRQVELSSESKFSPGCMTPPAAESDSLDSLRDFLEGGWKKKTVATRYHQQRKGSDAELASSSTSASREIFQGTKNFQDTDIKPTERCPIFAKGEATHCHWALLLADELFTSPSATPSRWSVGTVQAAILTAEWSELHLVHRDALYEWSAAMILIAIRI